jgi:hypothetical protein
MAEKRVNHELRGIWKEDVGPNLREGKNTMRQFRDFILSRGRDLYECLGPPDNEAECYMLDREFGTYLKTVARNLMHTSSTAAHRLARGNRGIAPAILTGNPV